VNLKVATVDVRLTGVEPVMGFITKVAEADALMRSMTKDQAVALPDEAARAMFLIQEALRLLEQADSKAVPSSADGSGPRDFSAEVGSHVSGRGPS
jgi:hypothetical protein